MESPLYFNLYKTQLKNSSWVLLSNMTSLLYRVLGRPVVDTSTQLVVQFGVSLIQIIDLDEKSQVLTVNVWNSYVSLSLNQDDLTMVTLQVFQNFRRLPCVTEVE